MTVPKEDRPKPVRKLNKWKYKEFYLKWAERQDFDKEVFKYPEIPKEYKDNHDSAFFRKFGRTFSTVYDHKDGETCILLI